MESLTDMRAVTMELIQELAVSPHVKMRTSIMTVSSTIAAYQTLSALRNVGTLSLTILRLVMMETIIQEMVVTIAQKKQIGPVTQLQTLAPKSAGTPS